MKLIDPMGEMLTQTWEAYATQLANAEQDDLLTTLQSIIEKEGIEVSHEAMVFVGKDTRYVYLSMVQPQIYELLMCQQLSYNTRQNSVCPLSIEAAVPASHRL